jgi:hypothetical protein
MQHDQNEKRTAPEGTARDSDYYFRLAVMLAGGGGLLTDLLTSEHSSDCYYSGNLRTAQWHKSCDRSNSDLN